MRRTPIPEPLAHALLISALAAAAVAGATTDVGSWNDAGRLATVESLVDQRTWRMDQSVFLHRTMDRAYIGGHFYSHRSPLPALALAVVYQVAQWTTGLKAAENPAAFCYTIALFSSGLAYVVAVLSIDRLAAIVGLSAVLRRPVTWSFAFGTLAFTFARAVNDHVLLLAVVGLLFLALATSATRGWNHVSAGMLIAIGTLTGVGYAIDLGVGPVLVACIFACAGWRVRPARRLVLLAAAALPWIALHHGLTYWIAGTWRPVGAVAEYMTTWPGSPFTADNLTGLGWAHDSVQGFVLYAIALLLGPKGFLVHNPVLMLLAPALLTREASRHDRALVLCAAGLIGGTFLMYAISSNNYAGATASIRWFLPLLVPCYYLLIRAVKHNPDLRGDVLVLGAWSIVLGILLWRRGPWVSSIGPRLWVVNAAALSTWIAYRVGRRHAG